MYLVDSNIWLERLLDRARSEEVGRFLEWAPAGQLHVSEFTIYSIGIILVRARKHALLREYLDDVVLGGAVQVIRLAGTDLQTVVGTSKRHRLDFDDAYRYAAAETHGLTIVSFDTDFDKTPKGRKTPSQAMKDAFKRPSQS